MPEPEPPLEFEPPKPPPPPKPDFNPPEQLRPPAVTLCRADAEILKRCRLAYDDALLDMRAARSEQERRYYEAEAAALKGKIHCIMKRYYKAAGWI